MIIVDLYNRFREVILYAIIGAFCALTDALIYAALCHLGFHYLLANTISVVSGILCSFILNRALTFKVKDSVLKRFRLFFLVGLLGLGISSGLLYIFIDIYSCNELVSKIITIAIVGITQFLLNKFITFKSR